MRKKQNPLLLLVMALSLATQSSTLLAQEISASLLKQPVVIRARAEWEKQRASLRTVYFEFNEKSVGTLAQWDYQVLDHCSAYFDQGHFYCQTKAPGYESYDNETAFDGDFVWRRRQEGILKTALADALGSPNFRLPRLPYLEAAGIFAPQYPDEIPAFTSVEPIGLHYLNTAELIGAESIDENLRLTFEVSDRLAAIQKEFSTNQPPSAKTSRKVALVFDPKRAFACTEREEWNIDGKRTARIISDDWKFFEKQGLWLPGRSIASYFARPRVFLSDFSDDPIHIATQSLTTVSFEPKDLSFSFGPKKERSGIFAKGNATKISTNAAAASDSIIERIQSEVVRDSQVMEMAGWLTDVYGPRLTGSSITKAAGEWAAQKIRSWGIENVGLEPWGPYENRGWTSERFIFEVTGPNPFIIHAAPMPWSISTKGRIQGPAVRFDVHSFAEMKTHAGKLNGAFLLLDPPQNAPPNFSPIARRLSEARLEDYLKEPPAHHIYNDIDETHYTERLLSDEAAREWLAKEGVAAILFTAPADKTALFLAGNGGGDARKKEMPCPLPTIKLAADSYGRIARILEKNIPVTLALDMENKFYDQPFVFNLLAEIPGNDPKLKDEVVMFGAHLDSWTFATGATDNGANCAVLMEALRILKALDLKPRRAIRIALWTGEEQGALGSAAYVAKHLQPETVGHSQFSAYFDIDSGAGKIRGIFTPGQPAARPVLDSMIAPFKDMGLKTISPWDIGGGDDNSFRSAHLPTFSFIQDPLEYETRTHHSDADVYERLVAEDLEFNSAVIAALAWESAQCDEKFPR